MHACNDTQHFKRNLILRWMSNKNDDDKLHDKAAFMDGDNKKECSMANNQGCLFKARALIFGPIAFLGPQNCAYLKLRMFYSVNILS
jgi:hypothetical protein